MELLSKTKTGDKYIYRFWSTGPLPKATQQPGILEYTKCDVQLIKVAPDDGLR
jgi:hypothetical protein